MVRWLDAWQKYIIDAGNRTGANHTPKILTPIFINTMFPKNAIHQHGHTTEKNQKIKYYTVEPAIYFVLLEACFGAVLCCCMN